MSNTSCLLLPAINKNSDTNSTMSTGERAIKNMYVFSELLRKTKSIIETSTAYGMQKRNIALIIMPIPVLIIDGILIPK